MRDSSGRGRTASPRRPGASEPWRGLGEAVLLELADRRRRRTPAGSTGRTRGCRRCRGPRSSSSMVWRSVSNATSSSKSPGTNRNPSASCFQTSSRNSVRACSLTESCTIWAKSWSAQSRRAKPTRREARRQQPAVGQVVDRRHHLLAGQVAGDAEEHHAAGPGDPREPPVLRVAQRVATVRRSRRAPVIASASRARRRRPPGRSGAAGAPGGRGRRAPARRRRPGRRSACRR